MPLMRTCYRFSVPKSRYGSVPLRRSLTKHSPKEWNNSDLCRTIVGTGIGKAFCVGGDVASECVTKPREHLMTDGRSHVDVVNAAVDPATRPAAIDYFQRE